MRHRILNQLYYKTKYALGCAMDREENNRVIHKLLMDHSLFCLTGSGHEQDYTPMHRGIYVCVICHIIYVSNMTFVTNATLNII